MASTVMTGSPMSASSETLAWYPPGGMLKIGRLSLTSVTLIKSVTCIELIAIRIYLLQSYCLSIIVARVHVGRAPTLSVLEPGPWSVAVITTEKAGNPSLSRDLARVTTPVTTSMAKVKSKKGHN